MEELLAMLGLGGGGLLVGEAYDKLGQVGDDAWSRSQVIGEQGAGLADFKGYGVTGPTGTGTVSDTGDVNFGLTQGQQLYSDQFGGLSAQAGRPGQAGNTFGTESYNAATGMIPGLMGDPSGREQDIYGRIRAMQQPEEQRQDLSLGSRLAAQGRTGLQTGQYGGSPEQFALDKSRGESMNAASYEAIRLAQQDQSQNANIMNMMGQGAGNAMGSQANLANIYGMLQYAPQQALLDQFGAGTNAYQYEDIARRQGANLQSEAQMGGLEGQLGASLGQANLMGNIGAGLVGGGMGMLGGMINSGQEFFGGLLGG